MKRFQVHASVCDMAAPISSYRDEVRAMHTQLKAADVGTAGETLHTLGSFPAFGKDTVLLEHAVSKATLERAQASCCAPQPQSASSSGCAK